MKVVSETNFSNNNQSEPQLMNGLDVRRSSVASPSLLEKTQEFFQICDSEGKGYITPNDMRVSNNKLFLCLTYVFNHFNAYIDSVSRMLTDML